MKITIEKQIKIVLEVADASAVTVVETPDSMAITVNNRSDGWLKKAYHFFKGVLKDARRRKAQRRWVVGFDEARAEKL
ncbi:hypothetical protein M573_126002 [Prevotella intermedia ZT]|uniref:Uncharacterized protein n=1 Tax=Prevotella intermedia ZT TaxID=1347790 RepID=A0AAP0YKD6_PREIN|nr:hypothetical protein [Prevotella intermedia]KJJ86398.1 hypothetical protein M573_126002 [Prevotella intermedia ZT]